MTDNQTSAPTLGERMPEFVLECTFGITHRLGGADVPATVVVFTSNTCPTALAWHERILALAHDRAADGVRTLAINSNDPAANPDESVEAMADRVDLSWQMYYLKDADGAVARSWGATHTPEIFVLDSDLRLRYHGAPDQDSGDETAAAPPVNAALDAILAGREVGESTTPLVGRPIDLAPAP